MRHSSIADEAAEWLVVLTDLACTDEERQSFVTWLRRSNLHVEEFLCISALTQRLTGPSSLPHADIEKLVQEAKADLAGADRVSHISFPNGAVPRSPRRRPFWLAAACIVPAIALFGLAVTRFDDLGWFAPTYSTSLGELRSIALEDGSVVQLNTQSRLRTRFTSTERRVELLSGEAVFKVAKNPTRPFRVMAGTADIVAVGTAFNVYAQRSRTVVTVLEGEVRVRDQTGESRSAAGAAARTDQEFELVNGEQAIITPHTPMAKAILADPRKVTSWTERRLIFEETPLAAAATEFSRYNSRSIRIESPKLGSLHITGVFDATDPASLVQFVEAYAGVAVRRDRNGWVLVSASID